MICIILEAGLSSRMGKQKLLLPFGAKSVIESVIDSMTEANLLPIHLVLSREVSSALNIKSNTICTFINENPERGQSSSLAIALNSLPDKEDFCIMLGDLPLVRPRGAMLLYESFLSMPKEKSVLAPCRDGVFGHPMFYRSVWKERFGSASGDIGGKKILMHYNDEIMRIEAADEHFRDMDTPEEYRTLLKN